MAKEMSPVLKLPIQFDLEKISDLIESIGIYKKFEIDECTLSLVNSGSGGDPWRDGTTVKVIEDTEDFPFSEADFTSVNEPLRDTYFEACYNEIKDYVDGRTGRVRLFRRPPQSTSSLHRDLDVRFHLALRSDQNSFLVFPDRGIYRIPTDGHVYLVDTTTPHFAVNTSTENERVHLIFDTYCGFKEKRGLEDQIAQSARDLFSEISKRTGVESC